MKEGFAFPEWRRDLNLVNKVESRVLHVNAMGEKHSTMLFGVASDLGMPIGHT